MGVCADSSRGPDGTALFTVWRMTKDQKGQTLGMAVGTEQPGGWDGKTVAGAQACFRKSSRGFGGLIVVGRMKNQTWL